MKSYTGKMIILDSSFLVAIEVETDQNHEKAVEIRDRIIKREFGTVLISDYIFDETITATFQKTRDLKKTILMGTNLRNAIQIINVEEETFEEAWNIFKKQENTKFSFTDCTILSIMKLHEIKHIATYDKDFEKVISISVIK